MTRYLNIEDSKELYEQRKFVDVDMMRHQIELFCLPHMPGSLAENSLYTSKITLLHLEPDLVLPKPKEKVFLNLRC